MKQKGSFVFLAFFLIASLAFAQVDNVTGTVTNDATQARLRIGNFIFRSVSVDLFIDGELAMNGNVPQADMHGFANGYLYLAPGTYSVAVAVAAGGRGLETAKFGPVDVTLEAGHRYTLGMMGKFQDEKYTPLLIDETAALEELEVLPGQSVLFLVNNLRGTETISFDQAGEGPKDVAYGSFGAAPITLGQGKEFVYTANDGEVLLSGTNWYRPEAPASDFMVALTGKFPGHPDITFETVESQRTSALNIIDFLRAYSATGFQHEGRPLSFDTFLSMIEAADLSEALVTGGPHLVYAPTDEAFAALPQDQLDALMADPEVMADVARYHIVEAYYSYGSLFDLGDALRVPTDTPGRIVITNLLGTELEHRIDRALNGVNVPVISAGMLSNGTRVRVIPQVLLPPTD